MAKRLVVGWWGQAVGAPLGADTSNQMLVPNGITCGSERLGSHMNHRPRERPLPLPSLLFLGSKLDTLLRFLESLEQGWGCGGGGSSNK